MFFANYALGSGYIARNMVNTSRETLARLAVHNPIFLVACNGDLVPYTDDMAQSHAHERTWSVDRAIEHNDSKLLAR